MKTRTPLLALLLASITLNVMAIEEPTYQLLAEFDDIEYRQYGAYLVAETIVTEISDRNDAANIGFRRLFKYISGENVTATRIPADMQLQSPPSESIAMTAPVRQRYDSAGWSIAFVVPAQFTRETVPQPTNPLIKIQEIPSQLMAVHRYTGRWTDENLATHQALLLEKLARAGIEPLGDVVGASYNSPFTLPFLRRNEVMVAVGTLPKQ